MPCPACCKTPARARPRAPPSSTTVTTANRLADTAREINHGGPWAGAWGAVRCGAMPSIDVAMGRAIYLRTWPGSRRPSRACTRRELPRDGGGAPVEMPAITYLSTTTHPTRRRRRRTASGLGLAGCIDRVGPRVAGSHSLTHSPSVTHQGLRSAEIAPEAPSRARVRFQVAFPTPENWNQKARPGAGRQPPPNPSGGEPPISSRQPS